MSESLLCRRFHYLNGSNKSTGILNGSRKLSSMHIRIVICITRSQSPHIVLHSYIWISTARWVHIMRPKVIPSQFFVFFSCFTLSPVLSLSISFSFPSVSQVWLRNGLCKRLWGWNPQRFCYLVSFHCEIIRQFFHYAELFVEPKVDNPHIETCKLSATGDVLRFHSNAHAYTYIHTHSKQHS